MYREDKERGKAMYTMPVPEVIDKVVKICKKNGVKRLDLFAHLLQGQQRLTVT